MAKSLNLLVSIAIVVSIAVVLFMPSGGAGKNGLVVLTQNRETIESYFEEGKLKQEIVDSINSQLDSVPEQLFELFGNNKMNIYITYDDGTIEEFFAVTKKNSLTEMLRGGDEHADVEIRFSEETIDGITSSKDPFSQFLNAMRRGKITYKGLNFEGEVKSATVKASTTILDVITGIIKFFTGFFE